METPFEWSDDLGPFQTLHIYEPSVQLRAIVVIDNVATGPSIGGLRVAPDVSLRECARLARAMTLKNAAAELPHGGGKSVLFADPNASDERKEELCRAFAASVEPLTDYIVGPDMGSDEQWMAWIDDEIGRSVGLPREIGGIPLDEIGVTGWGLLHAAEVGAEFAEIDVATSTFAVQGFGAVGSHAARFLRERGATMVAAADSQGTVVDREGLDVDELVAIKQEGGAVGDCEGERVGDPDAVIDVECDIWIPAARPDVLDEDNVDRLRANLVVQGANIPVTKAAEERLHERGVVNIPDFIANAGGVICAAMEHRGATESQVFERVDETIRRNTRTILERAVDEGAPPRDVALALAEERVRDAMSHRRWSLQSGRCPG